MRACFRRRKESDNQRRARQERDRLAHQLKAAALRQAGIALCRRGHRLNGDGVCPRCHPKRRVNEQVYVEKIMDLQAEKETAMPDRRIEIEEQMQQLHEEFRSQKREANVRLRRDGGARRAAATLLMALLLAVFLPAQVVNVANYSGAAFNGWKRCTVDVDLPHEAGRLPDGTRFVGGAWFAPEVR